MWSMEAVERVAQVLSGRLVLRKTVRTWADLERIVHAGLPKRSLQLVARRAVEPGIPLTVFRSEHVLTAYRIGSAAHPHLDGAGAAVSNDARWNSRRRQQWHAQTCRQSVSRVLAQV